MSVGVDIIKRDIAELFVIALVVVATSRQALYKDQESRFPEITLSEILHWRDREIQETRRWAKMLQETAHPNCSKRTTWDVTDYCLPREGGSTSVTR
jgi:hypothetical protein